MNIHNSTEIKGSEDFLKLNPELSQGITRPSKFGNVATENDGRMFQSGKEAKRAGELNLMLKAGQIFCLCYQVKFPVSKKISYVADFVYLDAGLQVIVEDAKGFKTDVYKLKKKLFKEQYGINITEV